MEHTIEKEFEIRKSIHMVNVVQLYLSHKYFNEAKGDAIVPPDIMQIAIAEQVVNDLERIMLKGDLKLAYDKADKYLISHNLDLDEFITRT